LGFLRVPQAALTFLNRPAVVTGGHRLEANVGTGPGKRKGEAHKFVRWPALISFYSLPNFTAFPREPMHIASGSWCGLPVSHEAAFPRRIGVRV
jgi:hypothetical protein